MHESFHATRKSSESSEQGGNEWKAQLPLLAGGRAFGRIEIRGNQHVDHHGVIRGLMDIAGGLENSLLDASASKASPNEVIEDESVSDSVSAKDVEAQTSI